MSLPPMATAILVYVGWFALPNLATNATVMLVNRVISHYKPNYTPPARGSPRAVDQWRYVYAFVMLSYLITTTAYSCLSMPLNFYEVLGVRPDADDSALKAAFRSFARRNHPDRVGPKGAPLFIAVRDAFEGLSHPVKRFAYDRFGPDAMTWTDCSTPREYLRHGLLASSGFYLGTMGFLFLWSLFGARDSGSYWRNLLLCTTLSLELFLIVNSPPGTGGRTLSFFPLSTLFPRRVPFQHALFLHQLYMSLSIAISRVIPVLFPITNESSRSTDITMSAIKPMVEKLASLATAADREVSRMLSAEIRSMHGPSAFPQLPNSDSSRQRSLNEIFHEDPFVPSDRTIAALTEEMESLFIDRQLQLHPALRGYWEAALERARGSNNNQSNARTAESATLPSPPQSLSPIERPKGLPSSSRQTDGATHNKLSSVRELANPLPSPPRELEPPEVGSGPRYSRGRSCSY